MPSKKNKMYSLTEMTDLVLQSYQLDPLYRDACNHRLKIALKEKGCWQNAEKERRGKTPAKVFSLKIIHEICESPKMVKYLRERSRNNEVFRELERLDNEVEKTRQGEIRLYDEQAEAYCSGQSTDELRSDDIESGYQRTDWSVIQMPVNPSAISVMHQMMLTAIFHKFFTEFDFVQLCKDIDTFTQPILRPRGEDKDEDESEKSYNREIVRARERLVHPEGVYFQEREAGSTQQSKGKK